MNQTFCLSISIVQRFRYVVFCLTAKLSRIDMHKHIFLFYRLFFKNVESRNEHTASTYLCANHILCAKQEVLQHLELMAEERIIVSISLSRNGLVQSRCADICNIAKHATVLFEIRYKLLLSFFCFG